MVDENILINLGLNAADATNTVARLTEQFNTLKTKIKEVADAYKTTFDIAAKAIAEQEIPKLKTPTEKEATMPKEDVAKAIAARVAEYQASMSAALTSVKQAETDEFNTFQNIEKQKQQMVQETAKVQKDVAVEAMKAQEDSAKQNLELQKYTEAQIRQDKLNAMNEREREIQQQIIAQKYLAENSQINFKPNIEAGVKDIQAFREQVDGWKQSISEMASTSGASFKAVADNLIEQAQAAGMAGDQFKQYQMAVRTAASELSSATPKVNTFGSVLKNAFAIAGIYSAIQLLRQVVQTLIRDFQELVKVGMDYSQSIYRFSVATQQLQRRGMDITMKQQIALVKELSAEYGVFSQKSVMDAVTMVELLTRNFGFSQEQIKKTTQLSMDLALVQGKDVSETAKELALFYSSGYGEGLQRAGIAVNRMTVTQEAHAMGLRKSYMQLTELERASAAYNLVMRQSVDLHQDAVSILDQEVGKIKAQQTAITDVTNEIALKALPIELQWLKVKTYLIGIIYDQINANEALAQAQDEIAKKYGAPSQMESLRNTLFAAPLPHQGEINKRAKEIYDAQKKAFEELKDELAKGATVKIDVNQERADAMQKLGDQIIQLWDDLEKAQEDYNKESINLSKDHSEKLQQIDEDTVDKLSDLWRSYQEKLASIQKDLDKTIADAQKDYARKLSDISQEENTSIADSNRKHHENELKAERDFQEQMRRLRENFLLDLQEALRQRDALQVLKLIQRYKLDVEQEKRGYDEKKGEEDRQHQQDLEDIRRNSEEKRRQAYEDLQQQIADARQAAEEKRADALAQYDQDVADAHAAAEKERQQEAEDYANRKAELAQQLEDRQNDLIEGFGKEVGIAGTSLADVKALFVKYFTDKGGIPDDINNYINKITESANATSDNVGYMQAALQALDAEVKNRVASINASLATLDWSKLSAIQQANQMPAQSGLSPMQQANQMPSGKVNNSSPSNWQSWMNYLGWGGGHASGAQNMVLTRPTMLMAGEVPERLDITPLNQLNSKGGNGGRAKVEILLSKDLEANIVDNTLGQFDFILRKELEKHE